MWAIKRAAREAEERGTDPVQLVLAELRGLREEVGTLRGLVLAVRAAQGPEAPQGGGGEP